MDKKVYIHNAVSLVPYTDITDNADRYCDKISLMCISSIKKLFSENEVADKNIPVFFGSSFSSLKSLHDFNMVYEKKGALSVNPGLFPNTVLNSPSCRASIYHKITQPIYNISNAEASGIDAFELACLYIKNGEVDNAVVCAAEESSPFAQAVCDTEIYDCCGAVYLSSNISDIEIERISRLVPENKQESINISVSAEFISLLHKSILDKETEIYISAGKSERYIKLKYLNREDN